MQWVLDHYHVDKKLNHVKNKVCISDYGLIHATNILKKIKGIKFIHFNEDDVIRHQLVKNIIKAYSKEEK